VEVLSSKFKFVLQHNNKKWMNEWNVFYYYLC
jgi:hypothetical protein